MDDLDLVDSVFVVTVLSRRTFSVARSRVTSFTELPRQ